MKRILYTLAAIFIGCILSCTPDKDEVLEMGPVDMDHIKEIKLRTSHYQILADGKAQLEFNPLLTTEDGFTVQDSRVDHSQSITPRREKPYRKYSRLPTSHLSAKHSTCMPKSKARRSLRTQRRSRSWTLPSRTLTRKSRFR